MKISQTHNQTHDGTIRRNPTFWKKNVIEKLGGYVRYEWVLAPYTIDVSIGRVQGYPGSNQVNVYSAKYGGWLLDTPKNFATIKDAHAFIRKAKAELVKGNEGEKVPFPR